MATITKKSALGRRKEKSKGGSLVEHGARPPDLSWIDEFIDNVRPYVFVRMEDRALIKMPNQAFHLNETGVRVMDYLLDGGVISDLLQKAGPEHAAEIELFLYQVKRCLEGALRETDQSSAIVVKPLQVNFSQLPVLAEVALTDRCNLRCIFCYAGCSCGVGGGQEEMTTSQVMDTIDKIFDQARVPSVSFTGGEPVMRQDLAELVAYASGKGMRVNLITNGTLMTTELAADLVQAGLASAQVSLEGVSASVHEAVTGVAGSFQQTLDGLSRLQEAGLHVHTNTTINRINIEECCDLPRFVRDHRMDKFSMNLIIPSGSAAVNTRYLLRYTEVGEILDTVIGESDRHDVEFMWYSPTPLCLFNPITRGLGNKGCSACDGLLSVDCEGNLLPCSSWDDPVGNLLEADFDRVWRSRKAESYRMKSMAPPGCGECDNFAVCHGACPLYWRHFGYDELPGSHGTSGEPLLLEDTMAHRPYSGECAT